MPTPFTMHIPDDRLAQIMQKVRAYDWDQLPHAGGCTAGVSERDLRRLISLLPSCSGSSPAFAVVNWGVNRPELVPEARGLLAAFLGLSSMYNDDLQQLEAGMILYDAFYVD